MNEWQVFENIVNGKRIYRVGRKLRADEPLHSGNVEYFTSKLTGRPYVYELEYAAERVARLMNLNLREGGKEQ